MGTTLQAAEELALATRLKRLSDRLYQDVDEAYQDLGHSVQSRWFGVLFLLNHNGQMGIKDLADEVGQTHSAISQLSKKLAAEDLVVSVADSNDSRRRLLELSSTGRKYVAGLQPMWKCVTAAVNGILQEADAAALLPLIGRLEQQLEHTSFRAEILRRTRLQRRDDVRLIDLNGEVPEEEAVSLRTAFHALNIEWLEEYFYVEQHDHEVLSDPDKHILEPGGHLFFAKLDDRVVGTGALAQRGDELELIKMAVAKSAQGLGIGEKLVRHAIATYRASGASGLFLESSQRLKPALKLYEKVGFKRMSEARPGSKYKRADVYMRFE